MMEIAEFKATYGSDVYKLIFNFTITVRRLYDLEPDGFRKIKWPLSCNQVDRMLQRINT